MKFTNICALLSSLILAGACQTRTMQADMIITGGKIYTMQQSQPQAQALAIKDGAIIAVGSDEGIRTYLGDETRHVQLEGEMVIPGLIEGHGHFLSMGYNLLDLDLLDTKNFDEIVDSVRVRVDKLEPGIWLNGRGWHQEKWDELPQPMVERFPTNIQLNIAAPVNPVILKHASGHAALANDKALEMAGITDTTPDPAGGTIVRDQNGKATGLLEENAADLVTMVYEAWLYKRPDSVKQREFKKVVRLAEAHCLEHGITTFHDAASTINEIEDLKKYHHNSGLDMRLSLMVYEPWERLQSYIIDNEPWTSGDNHLFVRSIKQYYDGALGSRGALLLEPYADDPDNYGHLTLDPEEYEQVCHLAATHGYQLCTHAIGDSANRKVLDQYEATFRQYPEAAGLRWRIEHVQHLHPDDIPRFAWLGVIPSMQSIHCTSDAPYVEARLGKQRSENGAYLWKSLLNSGAILMEGTDVPVERLNPFQNFYAAVTRKTQAGNAFYPSQRKTRKQALQGYTHNNAYGMQLEDQIGGLEMGKRADIAIIDTDLLTCEEAAIRDAKAIYTIIDGKIKYKRP